MTAPDAIPHATLSKRIPINIRYFLVAFIFWLLWMVAWVYAPGEAISYRYADRLKVRIEM